MRCACRAVVGVLGSQHKEDSSTTPRFRLTANKGVGTGTDFIVDISVEEYSVIGSVEKAAAWPDRTQAIAIWHGVVTLIVRTTTLIPIKLTMFPATINEPFHCRGKLIVRIVTLIPFKNM